ncbi:anti-sigma factor RsiW [Pseudarthrobacter sp. W1I19]|uniref:anti-sigma factor n=1 Tax=Pseudarthrobacter sp. W1I19 TaxID=3042288 RepID=UPI00278ABA92|nr:anti-sigma factor [Pseudarthrobacter sp. W1I19]MDQ0923678.1 anti-sigma factor RsiW [Pseudarthrobacter sp. W1I19]
MQHLDPEALSLFALDEPMDAGSADHLRSCPECTAEVAALRRAVNAARTVPDTGGLEAPGANVWEAIHRQLRLTDEVAADPLGPARGQDAAEGKSPSEEPRPAARPAEKPGSKVTWLRRPVTWLAAAAAAVVIAAGVVVAVNRTSPPVTLASAQLEPLARFTATGSATVTESGDGSRSIEVRLNKAEAGGYQEVWLIAPDLSRLVSLGIMNSSSGRFDVPAGLDLSSYPIVDVSDEPLDGNPAHSSVSIVRGTLSS